MRLSRILRIIQTEVSVICRSDVVVNNSFIIHSPRKIGHAIKKTNSFLTFLKKITALLKFMRDTAEKIRGHRADLTNTTFICQVQNLNLTNKCRIS